MSTPEKTQLFGITKDRTVAKTHQADEVVMFVSRDINYKITYPVSHTKNVLQLETAHETCMLAKLYKDNYYWGECNGNKVHVTLKKIKGELRRWS